MTPPRLIRLTNHNYTMTAYTSLIPSWNPARASSIASTSYTPKTKHRHPSSLSIHTYIYISTGTWPLGTFPIALRTACIYPLLLRSITRASANTRHTPHVKKNDVRRKGPGGAAVVFPEERCYSRKSIGRTLTRRFRISRVWARGRREREGGRRLIYGCGARGSGVSLTTSDTTTVHLHCALHTSSVASGWSLRSDVCVCVCICGADVALFFLFWERVQVDWLFWGCLGLLSVKELLHGEK